MLLFFIQKQVFVIIHQCSATVADHIFATMRHCQVCSFARTAAAYTCAGKVHLASMPSADHSSNGSCCRRSREVVRGKTEIYR